MNCIEDYVMGIVAKIIRQRGEQKSRLFIPSHYIPMALFTAADAVPEIWQYIRDAGYTPTKLATIGRGVCSPINQKSLFVMLASYVLGKRLRGEALEQNILDYCSDAMLAYRCDGTIFAEQNGMIRILSDKFVCDRIIESELLSDDERNIASRMCAALRTYLFCLNCEARGCMFSHGPYYCDSTTYIVGEFSHINKEHFYWLSYNLPINNIFVLYKGDGITLTDLGTPIHGTLTPIVIFDADGGRALSIQDIEKVEANVHNALKNTLEILQEFDQESRNIMGALVYLDFYSFLSKISTRLGYEYWRYVRDLLESMPPHKISEVREKYERMMRRVALGKNGPWLTSSTPTKTILGAQNVLLVLDADGTIFDSEDLIEKTIIRTCMHIHSAKGDKDLFFGLSNGRLRDLILLAKDNGVERTAEIAGIRSNVRSELRKIIRAELLKAMPRVFAGAKEAIREAVINANLLIVSDNYHEVVSTWLEKAGLGVAKEHVVTLRTANTHENKGEIYAKILMEKKADLVIAVGNDKKDVLCPRALDNILREKREKTRVINVFIGDWKCYECSECVFLSAERPEDAYAIIMNILAGGGGWRIIGLGDKHTEDLA
ncbi:MAG: hypothetical protein DRN20_02380 [Thermoplasmata archaeon]|nr:MAG: hypothetical protein DRN20_02380 [Thermoplasmata archaeon]